MNLRNFAAGLFLLAFIVPASAQDYFPPRGEWATISADDAGMDEAKLQEAIDFSIAAESKLPPELAEYVDARNLPLVRAMFPFTREPFDEVIGPMKPRAALSGIIIRKGRAVAEWGDTLRADMTNSITKTFLSSVAGLAWDEGLIRDVDDPVQPYVPTEHFEGTHNSKITWDHLLRQTSWWRGTLWGKPDWADRPGENSWSEFARETPEPGSAWKYNDVRVNVLAHALLHVWRQPLPDVLREKFMDPIGASNTWRWHGYDTSWVQIDGKDVQSVSGGGHWGGGMFISAWDLARLGYLALNKGRWGDKQILSEDWISMSRTPTGPNPGYGYMNYFLNTGKEAFPRSSSK